MPCVRGLWPSVQVSPPPWLFAHLLCNLPEGLVNLGLLNGPTTDLKWVRWSPIPCAAPPWAQSCPVMPCALGLSGQNTKPSREVIPSTFARAFLPWKSAFRRVKLHPPLSLIMCAWGLHPSECPKGGPHSFRTLSDPNLGPPHHVRQVGVTLG